MSGEVTVHQADAVQWLRGIASESVDLIVTDPAYESLEKHRARGTTTRLKHSKASSNDWFQVFPNARFPDLFAEAYERLRKSLPPGDTRSARVVLADAVVAAREGKL